MCSEHETSSGMTTGSACGASVSADLSLSACNAEDRPSAPQQKNVGQPLVPGHHKFSIDPEVAAQRHILDEACGSQHGFEAYGRYVLVLLQIS